MTLGERNNRIALLAKRQNRPSVQNKRKVDDGDESLSVDQAARVLRAIEISRPSSSYNLRIDTQPERAKNKKKKAHIAPLRGRVVLPVDFRPTADKILVFALPGSADFRIAQAAGVDYVGGAEMFQQLIDGEIEPDKVLSSTNMIGPVTSTLARFLGPKGLMPTARRGLVGEGEMLANIIREAKGGLDWRANDDGRIDMIIGRVNISINLLLLSDIG
ncbi:ribosomal protein L1-like protein [Naematelia encephala]|uniref:Ribosomal protein n=1 Tax=Naematelia encephala TaxID=71784 RepID=A0A1Y2B9T2_9TREE|nr:ribosomal protein L1-like protein [Naematelia encephala]